MGYCVEYFGSIAVYNLMHFSRFHLTCVPLSVSGALLSALKEYHPNATMADQGITAASPYGPYLLRPPENSYNTYVVEDLFVSTGKWYWEIEIITKSQCPQIGVVARGVKVVKDSTGVGKEEESAEVETGLKLV